MTRLAPVLRAMPVVALLLGTTVVGRAAGRPGARLHHHAGGAAARISARSKSEPAPAPPKPSFTVSLGRLEMRERDCIEAAVWLVNDSELPLTDCRLNASGPGFLEWADPRASGADGGGHVFEMPIGSVPPRSVVSRTLRICTGPNVETGDFNLLFTLRFSWTAAGKLHASLLAAEKPLKVNLLGTDSLAGIPLNLAIFILPGLAFWLVLAWFDTGWGVGLAIGDKMVYSVLVSGVIIYVFGFPLERHGLGLAQLAALGALGGVVGLPVALLHRGVQRWARWREQREWERVTILANDPDDVKLEKILMAAGSYREPRHQRVRVRDEGEYFGALTAVIDGRRWLTAWHRITVPPDRMKEGERIRALLAANQLLNAVRLARELEFPIVPRSQLRLGGMEDQYVIADAPGIRSWPETAVLGDSSERADANWGPLDAP